MFVQPGEGACLTALGSTYTHKAGPTETRGGYVLVEEEFWGDPTPLHSHTDAEEAFYVLSGELAAWVGTGEVLARTGSFLLIPRGTPHAVRRLTDEPVRLLTLISPPGFERFFQDVVREGEQALLKNPDRLAALAADSGTAVLGDYPFSEQGSR